MTLFLVVVLAALLGTWVGWLAVRVRKLERIAELAVQEAAAREAAQQPTSQVFWRGNDPPAVKPGRALLRARLEARRNK